VTESDIENSGYENKREMVRAKKPVLEQSKVFGWFHGKDKWLSGKSNYHHGTSQKLSIVLRPAFSPAPFLFYRMDSDFKEQLVLKPVGEEHLAQYDELLSYVFQVTESDIENSSYCAKCSSPTGFKTSCSLKSLSIRSSPKNSII
jgi:hypothetical protein